VRRKAKAGGVILATLIAGVVAPCSSHGSAAEARSGGEAPSASEILLTEDGQTRHAIVIARDASMPARFAADELQKYVLQISGARLPILAKGDEDPAICVTENGALDAGLIDRLRPELSGRGEDGYLVRTEGNQILLLGNSPRATLYAVYHFLEAHLGCAWCAPGDDTVPREKTIRVPPIDDRVGPPALGMRQIILYPYGGEWLQQNNLPHTDWLAKNRFNWAHPAPNGPYSWERNKSRETLVPEVEKRGLYLEVGGHTFNTWLPPDRYADEHPEYYALLEDGTRATAKDHKGGLCLSHPQVAKEVAANIIAWLHENPEVDAVDLWHNDSRTYCRCPNCAPRTAEEDDGRLAYTRMYIRFTNQVAALVARRHPNVLINFLAYAHTTDCPPGAEPLADNVLVGLCLFPRPSQRTMRPLETSPQRLDAHLRREIPAWRKLAKHFYIYEYYTFSPRQKVWSMVSMMSADVPYLVESAVDGISSDQWGPGWYPLNMYAFGKLTWNPELTPQEIIDDFCAKYYGRAAPPMARYWSTLEEGLRESWSTDRPIDWRDQKRAELIKQALSEADSQAIGDRIRAAAALHGLSLEP